MHSLIGIIHKKNRAKHLDGCNSSTVDVAIVNTIRTELYEPSHTSDYTGLEAMGLQYCQLQGDYASRLYENLRFRRLALDKDSQE